METILFIDHVGFNVVGKKVDETKTTLTVKNPAILQAAPNAQNQLQVQLMPVLFKEFLKEDNRDTGVEFSYPKDKIVISNAKLEDRLEAQYSQMFNNAANTQQGDSKKDPEVIKLFDE